MYNKINKIYINLSCGLLLTTGLAKLVSAFGAQRLLNENDPVIGIKYQYILISVGIVELIAAMLCLRSSSIRRKNEIIFGLASCFAAYRICLLVIDEQPLCHCLGTLGEMLKIPAWLENVSMTCAFLYLFIGSGIFICAHLYRSFVYAGRERNKPHT